VVRDVSGVFHVAALTITSYSDDVVTAVFARIGCCNVPVSDRGPWTHGVPPVVFFSNGVVASLMERSEFATCMACLAAHQAQHVFLI